jgi:hypothetical protein
VPYSTTQLRALAPEVRFLTVDSLPGRLKTYLSG